MNTTVQNSPNGNVSAPKNETKEVKIIPVNAAQTLDLSLKRIADASRMKKYLENINDRFQNIQELEFEDGHKLQSLKITDIHGQVFETPYYKIIDKVKSMLLEELKFEREKTIEQILNFNL
jgi:hypothetical protein